MLRVLIPLALLLLGHCAEPPTAPAPAVPAGEPSPGRDPLDRAYRRAVRPDGQN